MPRSDYSSIEDWEAGIVRREKRRPRRAAPQYTPATPPSELPAHLRGLQERLIQRTLEALPPTPPGREELRERYPRVEPRPLPQAAPTGRVQEILERAEREAGLPEGLLRAIVKPDATEVEAQEVARRAVSGVWPMARSTLTTLDILTRPLDVPGAMLVGGAEALGRAVETGEPLGMTTLRGMGRAASEMMRPWYEDWQGVPPEPPTTIAEAGYRAWVPEGMEHPSLGRQVGGVLTGLAGAALTDPLIMGLPLTRGLGAVPSRMVAARDIPVAARAASRVFPRALQRDVERAIMARAREGLGRAARTASDDPIVAILRGSPEGQDVIGEIGRGVYAGIQEAAPGLSDELAADAMVAFSRRLRANIEPGWRYYGHRIGTWTSPEDIYPRGTPGLMRRAEGLAPDPEGAARIVDDVLRRREVVRATAGTDDYGDALRKHIGEVAREYGTDLAAYEERALTRVGTRDIWEPPREAWRTAQQTFEDIVEAGRAGARTAEAAWRRAREAATESGARAQRHAGEVWRTWFEPSERRALQRQTAAARAAETRLPRDLRAAVEPIAEAHEAALRRAGVVGLEVPLRAGAYAPAEELGEPLMREVVGRPVVEPEPAAAAPEAEAVVPEAAPEAPLAPEEMTRREKVAEAARMRWPHVTDVDEHLRVLRSAHMRYTRHGQTTLDYVAEAIAGDELTDLEKSIAKAHGDERRALERRRLAVRRRAAQEAHEILSGPVARELGFEVEALYEQDPGRTRFVAPRGVRWPTEKQYERQGRMAFEEAAPEVAPEAPVTPEVTPVTPEVTAPADWQAVAETLPPRAGRRLPDTVLHDEGLEPMPLPEALRIYPSGETPAEKLAAAWDDFNNRLPEELDRLKYPESEEARAAYEGEVRAMLSLARAADALRKGEEVADLPAPAEATPPPHESTARDALAPEPTSAPLAHLLAEPLGPATEQIPPSTARVPFAPTAPIPPGQGPGWEATTIGHLAAEPVAPEKLEEVIREGEQRTEARAIEADVERGLAGLRRRMEQHYHRFPGWRRGGVELQDTFKNELMRVLHPLERISSTLARIIRPLDNQRRSWLTVLAGIMEPDIIRERGALDLPEGELFEVSPEGKVRIALAATDQPVADAATYVDADGNVLVDDLPGPTRDLWQRAENWLRMYHDIYFGTERMIGLRDIAEELGIEVGYIPGYVAKFGATALPEDVVDFVKRQLAPYAKHPEVKEFIEALSPGPEQTLPADVIQQAIDTLELPDEVKVLLAELEGKTLDEVREALAAQVPAATLDELMGFFRPRITERATFTGPTSKIAEAAALLERGDEGDVGHASRLIVELDAGLQLLTYMSQFRFLAKRLAVKRFVERCFATEEALEASGEGRAAMARAQGGTDELGQVFPELKGYLLPEPVNDVLMQELGWAGLDQRLMTMARTGGPFLQALRNWVRPIKIPLLLTWRFAMSANLPEQADNLVRLGVFPSPRRARLAARVLAELVLEQFEMAPPATGGERVEQAVAAVARHTDNLLRNAWRRLREIVADDPEETLSEEELERWLQEFNEYNPAAVSMGYQVAQEFRGRRGVTDVLVDYVRRRYGAEMHLVTQSAQELGDLTDLAVDLIFGMDTLTRAIAYIGLREKGYSPAEAVRHIDRETANYHPLAHMPVDDKIGAMMLFWTYARQRTQQLVRKVQERPFLAPYLASVLEDVDEATGHNRAQQVVLEARPGWMGAQHLVVPWEMLPGIIPLSRESPVYEELGPLLPVVSVRGPTLEHPSDLWELLRTPFDEITWRVLPPANLVSSLERGGRGVLRELPIIGNWTRLFREMPHPEGIAGIARTRALARGGMSLEPDEISRLVQAGRVPERLRAPEKMWREDPERASQYEYDYMRLYSQIDALESFLGVNIMLIPVENFINNMTPEQLVRVIKLQEEEDVQSGIPTERFVEELQQRWVREQGPTTWAEQQGGFVRGTSRAARQLLEPLLQPEEGVTP